MRTRGARAHRLIGIAAIAAVLATACATSGDEDFTCSVPTSKSVDQAFTEAREDLAHPQCQFQFDAYVETLLDTAAESPGEANRKRFSELFGFARDEGILSESQAASRYRRYFTSEFVTLETRYNNCSTTCRNTEEVRRELRAELDDKDLGLLRVADDEQAFDRADREFNQLLTLIEATCSACSQE